MALYITNVAQCSRDVERAISQGACHYSPEWETACRIIRYCSVPYSI